MTMQYFRTILLHATAYKKGETSNESNQQVAEATGAGTIPTSSKQNRNGAFIASSTVVSHTNALQSQSDFSEHFSAVATNSTQARYIDSDKKDISSDIDNDEDNEDVAECFRRDPMVREKSKPIGKNCKGKCCTWIVDISLGLFLVEN